MTGNMLAQAHMSFLLSRTRSARQDFGTPIPRRQDAAPGVEHIAGDAAAHLTRNPCGTVARGRPIERMISYRRPEAGPSGDTLADAVRRVAARGR